MKKLIIICEGPTEQYFCKQILENHFKMIGIEIEFPLITHSNGGIVKWIHLMPQITTTFAADPNCFVTTFIDFYGMEAHHNFPEWASALLEPNKANKMNILENGMKNALPINLQTTFIPYIQLHEFEAIVFSDYLAFENFYEANEADFPQLKIICDSNPNPETINNSIITAPSKRLQNHIPRYDKKSHGIPICEFIGLATIRNKCTGFNNWITRLEAI
jgi:hypothetical protein